MKYVVFYEAVDDVATAAAPHLQAHQERLKDFHARGTLLMAGALGSPPTGAMGVFTSREAADEFIAGDPFVTGGVVRSHRVQEWNEVLTP
ncbi:YciI family protein [Pseudonocardia acidicola]|uniref:YCII-related domain-containing protein n=1 Tax=Pseudonocardia acidicola TaxID=2724939 RepID=A0ABX1S9D6_9PSEU|nr:YciI family protein [Pseudonocardia acidicola]NMH96961.1 hypothetical protein [Pseudonocardia acidicola]